MAQPLALGAQLVLLTRLEALGVLGQRSQLVESRPAAAAASRVSSS